jgi:hypothetical protein
MTHVINQEVVREFFRLDEDEKHLIWKSRDKKWFKSNWAFLVWNQKYPENPYGCVDQQGYIFGTVLYKRYREHTLMWLYQTGELPKAFIDHINGDRQDNRIKNLREVSPTYSTRNLKIRSNNKSGFHGVYWSNASKKWVSQIGIGGHNKYLGGYNCPKEAAMARINYLKEYGYHENHGRI